jgi:hypothetical protein
MGQKVDVTTQCSHKAPHATHTAAAATTAAGKVCGAETQEKHGVVSPGIAAADPRELCMHYLNTTTRLDTHKDRTGLSKALQTTAATRAHAASSAAVPHHRAATRAPRRDPR